MSSAKVKLRPMSEAPKDGTIILAYWDRNVDKNPKLIEYYSFRGYSAWMFHCGSEVSVMPSGWIPVPEVEF